MGTKEGGAKALKPIFVFSGFRASSTWLWSKFRRSPQLTCYYEPMNEQLANLSRAQLAESTPEGWRSHHPQGAPYFMEYAPLVGDAHGVAAFPKSMADLGKLFASNDQGELDAGVAEYFKSLIDAATGNHRRSLLACTRLLGNVDRIRREFDGYHILLTRNLFHQWNSYCGQALHNNYYFLETLFLTLRSPCDVDYINKVRKLSGVDQIGSFEDFVSAENRDAIFCYFVLWSLYWLAMGRQSADLHIDANRLARDETYRLDVEARIRAEVGIDVDLSDATESLEIADVDIGDVDRCKMLIGEALVLLDDAIQPDGNACQFIEAQVDDLWSGLDQYSLIRRAASELRTRAAGFADAQAHALGELTASSQQRDELENRVNEQAALLDARTADLAQQVADLEELTCELDSERTKACVDRTQHTNSIISLIFIIQGLTQEIEERGRSIERSLAASEQLKAKLAKAHASGKAKSKRVAKLVARIDDLEVSWSSSQDRIAELVELRAESDVRLRHLDRAHVDLASRLDGAIKRYSEAESNLSQVVDRNSQLLRDMAVLRNGAGVAGAVEAIFAKAEEGHRYLAILRRITERGIIRNLAGQFDLEQGRSGSERDEQRSAVFDAAWQQILNTTLRD